LVPQAEFVGRWAVKWEKETPAKAGKYRYPCAFNYFPSSHQIFASLFGCPILKASGRFNLMLMLTLTHEIN
jgi:hypothetical protein